MQVKALTDGLGTSVSSPSHRHKRIDLVVTDYEFADELAGRRGTDGLQPEFRCTIPVALLDGDITGEVLREAARFCRPWAGDPISAKDLLRLIQRLLTSLNRPADRMFREPIAQADPADEMRISRLTPRELQVLEHVVSGDPNKRTAAALNISRRTVEHHRAVIMQKTRTKSVPDLVRLALRTGLFQSGHTAHD